MFGPYLPNVINGIFIVLMGVLTLFKQVVIINIVDVNEQQGDQGSTRFGNKLFNTCNCFGCCSYNSIELDTFKGGAIGLGVSSIIGLISAYWIIKPKFKFIGYD
ncbi:membrane protein [Staphylococcus gallinarum]|uniref:Membrane protein n=1 Tax=Staphylococcus gallinarum TaxID=1293 RepID=A0A380FLG2_STAGA|nr:membrane protein [Staphylococcus gallinarum]